MNNATKESFMLKQFLATSLVCISAGAHAEGAWNVGVLAFGTTGTYIGEDNEAGLAPVLSYETENLYIGLDGLSYKVLDFESGQISVALGYRDGPGFPDDDPLFDGLEREAAVELGINSVFEFGSAFVAINSMTDISDAHGGSAADFSLGYVMAPGAFQVSAALGARVQDAKLNQYLYGVTAAEATSDRSAFTADRTTTAFASMTVAYPLSGTVTAIGAVDYEDLGDNANSPLVDKSDVIGVGFGLVMTF
jgi:outer membrane protein